MHSVTIRAPGKVNLALRVGRIGKDGYHPVVTVYQAVNIYEYVTAELAPSGSGINITINSVNTATNVASVPNDQRNIAYRAATLLAKRMGISPNLVLNIAKSVPVAGGMAGGSADGAATLLACNELWECGLSGNELRTLASELGSDVPFSLMGGTAIGTGRGELLTPIDTAGRFHWVFGLSDLGLATPTVYRKFDELTEVEGSKRNWECDDALDVELLHALAIGDVGGVGAALSNDLQAAALALRPELTWPIEVALALGAHGAIVSGSGPTIAALARSELHAQQIATAWRQAGAVANAIVTTAPASSAQIAA